MRGIRAGEETPLRRILSVARRARVREMFAITSLALARNNSRYRDCVPHRRLYIVYIKLRVATLARGHAPLVIPLYGFRVGIVARRTPSHKICCAINISLR